MQTLKKWEISLMIGVAATILCCAARPELTLNWWTTAFSPLCDGILGAETADGGLIVRSRLWELLAQLGT